MQELLIIRGLPGTGKSFFAQKHYPNYVNLEIEDFFTFDGEYRFDSSKVKDAHMWCLYLTKFYLNQGDSVTIASTFCREWEIMGYIGAALKYKVQVQLVECSKIYGNPHNVPSYIISQMRDSWESFSLEHCFEKYHKKQSSVAEKNQIKNYKI